MTQRDPGSGSAESPKRVRATGLSPTHTFPVRAELGDRCANSWVRGIPNPAPSSPQKLK